MAIIIFAACIIFFRKGRNDNEVFRNFLKDTRYVVHAGGFVQSSNGELLPYTNSRESLETCYENGNRVSEFDFALTSDDELVCAHYHDGWVWGFEFTQAPTKEEFLKARFMNELTSMSLSDLVDFIKEHPDFYVVTDCKKKNKHCCEKIKEMCPDLLDHFIVQIYHRDQYQEIYDMGFHRIIYTLYKCKEEELQKEVLTKDVKEMNLVGVTLSVDRAQNKDWLKALLDTGVPLFVHTVNETDEMKSYFDEGIAGIYTDVSDMNLQYWDTEME
nr:glycerophosphodiester phosphodiesterase family protein [Butyrivibrio sp. WCD3002]